MTLAMKKTDAYASLHAKLVQEVRSEPLEAPEDAEVGNIVHCLLSAQAAVCALPDAMLAEDDIRDIRNVIRNLSLKMEGL